VSTVLYHVGLWGLGGRVWNSAPPGGFFFYMDLGVVMEEAFKKTTGLRMRGFLG
jgi:hypothetical protein